MFLETADAPSIHIPARADGENRQGFGGRIVCPRGQRKEITHTLTPGRGIANSTALGLDVTLVQNVRTSYHQELADRTFFRKNRFPFVAAEAISNGSDQQDISQSLSLSQHHQ